MLSPATASVMRTADNVTLVIVRTQGTALVSSMPTPVVDSDAGKPGNGSCICVPVRKSIEIPGKFRDPSAFATGVPSR
ncbi:hypothetical protein D3C71_1221060 [compost metagenome]